LNSAYPAHSGPSEMSVIRPTELVHVGTLSQLKQSLRSLQASMMTDDIITRNLPSTLTRLKSFIFLLDAELSNPNRGPGVDAFWDLSKSCRTRVVVEYIDLLLGEMVTLYPSEMPLEQKIARSAVHMLRDHPGIVPADAHFSLKSWSSGATFFRNHLDGTSSGEEARLQSEIQMKQTGLLNGSGILSVFPAQPTEKLRFLHSVTRSALIGSSTTQQNILAEARSCSSLEFNLFDVLAGHDFSVYQELQEAFSQDKSSTRWKRFLQVAQTSRVLVPKTEAAWIDFGFLLEGYYVGLATDPWLVLAPAKEDADVIDLLGYLYRSEIVENGRVTSEACQQINRVLQVATQAGFRAKPEWILAKEPRAATRDAQGLITSLVSAMATQSLSSRTGESVELASECLGAFRRLVRVFGDRGRNEPMFVHLGPNSAFETMRNKSSKPIWVVFGKGEEQSAWKCAVNGTRSAKLCSFHKKAPSTYSRNPVVFLGL